MTEKTERCWSCRKEKPISQIDMTKGNYTSGICLDCIQQQKEKLEATDAKIIHKEEPNQWSGWHCQNVTYKYVAIEANGKIFTIPRRYTNMDWAYDTSEVFNLTQKFIDSNYKSLLLYGNVESLVKEDFWWYITKKGEFYKICGNCFKISNAFWLETLDLDSLLKLIERWTPLPNGLREHVKEQINKGLVFASNPKSFEREKILCFQDYSNYDKRREPETHIIKGLEVA